MCIDVFNFKIQRNETISGFNTGIVLFLHVPS